MPPLLELRGIRKTFPGVVAVDGVDFDLRAGEVHLLAGENGAGKSTLMKVLAGVYPPDAGSIALDGQPCRFAAPRDALAAGIAMIYQELTLAPHLSVMENVFLGTEPLRWPRLGWVDRAALRAKTAALLAELHLPIAPETPVHALGLAHRQMVEIARALAARRRVIVMDEPTACLTRAEVDELFAAIRRLRARGAGIVYISHRLEEFRDIGDRLTVLRDGRRIATADVAATTPDGIIRWMVGRELRELYPPRECQPGAEVLRVRGLARRGVLRDISFALRQGEVLGLAGLVGAGRTELARALFAADPVDAGAVWLHGQPIRWRSPRDAIAAGLGLLTEDRVLSGLALSLSVAHNLTLAALPRFGRFVLHCRRERAAVRQYLADLQIKAANPDVPAVTLSGGNQQKLVLAKWLCAHARVLIFDEPTRGIDVGARQEVYRLMNDFVRGGGAILLISSDLPELLGVCDRLLVMREGALSGEFVNDRLDAATVLAAALPRSA